jgi:SAM-dependent methyltransferase
MLTSKICNQSDMEQIWFREACVKLREGELRYHRKLWEYCYIYQALKERGMLAPYRRGLGFGVGREPLGAAFASHGCEVVMTDMDEKKALGVGWTNTNEYAGELEILNDRGICEPREFWRLASFEVCDLNRIPDEYSERFDFTWSSCVFEHCGSIELGRKFISNQAKCLKPGGVAVHTTEYNLSSDEETVESGDTVIFRRKDIQAIADDLRMQGIQIEIDFSVGKQLYESYVDLPPYSQDPHLRLLLWKYIATSIGLIITKP